MERICSLSYQHAGDVTFEESSLLADDPYWQQLTNHIADRQWAIKCRFNLGQVKLESDEVRAPLQLPQQVGRLVKLYAA